MGQVDLPQVEPKGQKSTDEWLYHVANVLAQVQAEMQNILEGRISADNIRANSIETKNLKAGAVTADKITVTELSAISADLGHITAGLVEAIDMVSSTITGSLIQTATPGVYPRIEFSATEDLLKALTSATQTLSIIATWLGFPVIRMEDGPTNAMMYLYKDTLTSRLSIESSTNIRMVSNVGDIDLVTSGAGAVKYNGVQIAKVNDAGRTLTYNSTTKVLSLLAGDSTLLSSVTLV